MRSVRDLRGKRVGTAGIPYQSAYLKTILERANVPESSVKETNVGASLLPAMLSGQGRRDAGRLLERRGRRAAPAPPAAWIAPVDRLGVPDYDELVLVANADERRRPRDDLRLFISAVARGARQAARDPACRGAT